MTLAQAARHFASRGQATHLAVFVYGVTDPVGLWVSTDRLVEWIHQDDLKEFVGGIIADPV